MLTLCLFVKYSVVLWLTVNPTDTLLLQAKQIGRNKDKSHPPDQLRKYLKISVTFQIYSQGVLMSWQKLDFSFLSSYFRLLCDPWQEHCHSSINSKFFVTTDSSNFWAWKTSLQALKHVNRQFRLWSNLCSFELYISALALKVPMGNSKESIFLM